MACVLALAGACRFGDARFESTLDGRAFEPTGTVFGYTDARDGALDEDDNPRVVVALTWVVFDPRSDLDALDGRSLADLTHELALRDALALVFDRLSDVQDGAEFTSVALGQEEQVGGTVSARLHLAPEPLDAQSTYADLVPLASRRTTRVTITDETLGGDNPSISGDVVINFERQERDAGNAHEGELRGSFVAPIVEERVAEHNLALLDVEDALGLPLGPRALEDAP